MVELPISEAFNLYRRDFIAFKGLSKKTEEAYCAARDTLLKRFGDRDICTLTFDDARDYKLWLDKGRQPNTVRNYVVCLRVVLNFLKRRGYGVMNDAEIPIPKRVNKEVEYLTELEFVEFLQSVSAPHRGYSRLNRLRNAAIVQLLYATGLRNSELCALNRNSIKDRTFTVIGKGSKTRIGFVSDEAMESIQTYLATRTDTNKALFIGHKSGKRITPGGIRLVFQNVCGRSEFENIHPHTIRHSYATKLLKRRVDIRYVSEFMGHSSLDTTKLYTHLVNDDLKEIYERAINR